MNKFSERLKQLRIEKKLSQKELATILEVDQRSVSNWEKAVREPDYAMLIKIADYFEVSADYLLGLED
ncbi:MAG: helix-turn-helix transcriptional regulator [Clostridia bacterium]|nr:helix-turn-helix transcriptional regulator [Clostridia bacterium]